MLYTVKVSASFKAVHTNEDNYYDNDTILILILKPVFHTVNADVDLYDKLQSRNIEVSCSRFKLEIVPDIKAHLGSELI